MYKNSYKMLFIFLLMFGSLISISSNSWMSAWMGLEINLLSFIPLMNKSNNLLSSESSLKYFLIQVLASSIILFMIIIYMNNYMNFDMILYNKLINSMMMMALMMKMGIPPFHFWFPSIIEGLEWFNCLIMLIWQKIAPFMLMSYLMLNYSLLSVFLSMIIGTLGGLNQISLRKIMAYSSINHLSWMLISLYLNNIMWLNYFLFYMFISMPLIFYFMYNKLFFINQLYFLNYSNNLKLILLINFFSFGGLPPFLGFFPKWMIIEFLSENFFIFMIFFLVIFTLITLFYYIRISFSGLMLFYYEPMWKFKMEMKFINMFIYLIMSFFSIFGLLIINIFYYMF